VAFVIPTSVDTDLCDDNKSESRYFLDQNLLEVLIFSSTVAVLKRKYVNGGMRWRSWLRHYATSRKVADSILDEVSALISIYLILPAALWPWG
jgi:hypothetical protein